MKRFAIACAAAVLSLGAGPASAQSGSAAAQVPAVFSALEGEWSGMGTLMGRPARFEMEWRAQEGGFIELRFQNALVDTSGTVTVVLRARAVYRPSGTTAMGVWIDSRPQRIQLESEITETAVITNWSAATENGRTEYRIDQEGVTVRDYVETDGEMRLFAEAQYTRVSGGT